jgi:hypothetical protein
VTYSPGVRETPWETYHIKDGSKGPMVWRAKRTRVWLPDENGLPGRPYHLLVTQNVLNPEEVKYFISNAPEGTWVETLLLVAFSRWKIERLFETSKTELGLDHFEVRRFLSVQRHLILSCVSHLFLAEFCLNRRGEKPGLDGGTGADGGGGTGACLGASGPLFAEVGRSDLRTASAHATPQRSCEAGSSQEDPATPSRPWPETGQPTQVFLEHFLAL